MCQRPGHANPDLAGRPGGATGVAGKSGDGLSEAVASATRCSIVIGNRRRERGNGEDGSTETAGTGFSLAFGITMGCCKRDTRTARPDLIANL